jgi:uncharacterized protein (DUF952 family)
VHCSTAAQLQPVADALFAGQTGLCVLEIDPAALGDALRWEPAAGPAPVPGPFPHVYGKIPVAAVRAVVPLRP